MRLFEEGGSDFAEASTDRLTIDESKGYKFSPVDLLIRFVRVKGPLIIDR